MVSFGNLGSIVSIVGIRVYFNDDFPVRTTFITEFVSPNILVQIDAIAYKPRK